METRTRRPRPPSPDPNTVYAVPIDGSPFRGRKNAKVTLIRFYEFACPYCERSRGTMEQLMKDYPRDLRIVHKHYIVHPQTATKPALAACAAQMQNRFFDMEKALWEQGYKVGRNFSDANIEKMARKLKLNMKNFRRDMKGNACAQRIKDDQALGVRVGTRGTPAFYINGRFLSGARPAHLFRGLIDEELRKANDVLKRGVVKKAGYYDYVVKNGKTSL